MMTTKASAAHANRRCFKCRYNVRWFNSRQVCLILAWVVLYSMSISSFARIIQVVKYVNKSYYYDLLWPIIYIALFFMVLITLLVGWLAFSKFGIFFMMRFGTVLMFIAGLAISTATLFESTFSSVAALSITYTPLFIVFIVGASAVIVTILPFGLDQMPDASPANILSFIVWFIFSCCTGSWVTNVLYSLCWTCYENHYSTLNGVRVWCLSLVLSITLILASSLVLKTGWLIVNKPKPNKFTGAKIVYRVLKYARMHKFPVNRSALTYWEENVPSRIDLGKARFGGPFTTEQVEDVKTALRLLVVSVALWVISIGSAISIPATDIVILLDNSTITYCASVMIDYFSSDSMWGLMIITILFELLIYPFVCNKLPTILKRIGIFSFILTALSILCLVLELIHDYVGHVPNWSKFIVINVSKVITLFLISALLELICAQAPCNMRGFFVAYGTVIFIMPNIIALHFSTDFGDKQNVFLIIFGIKSIVSLFGFVFYCLLARWYSRRVRDEEYHTQTVVEEVYDRYLSAEQRNINYCENRN